LARLILANIPGLPVLAAASSTIGSIGPAAGSGDDHSAELMGCKNIIKKM
jgi:hypothetical protein